MAATFTYRVEGGVLCRDDRSVVGSPWRAPRFWDRRAKGSSGSAGFSARTRVISRGLVKGHAALYRPSPRAFPLHGKAGDCPQRWRWPVPRAASDRRAWRQALRPKACKLATHPHLQRVVATLLRPNCSPQQIAGWLRRNDGTSRPSALNDEKFRGTRGCDARLGKSHGVRATHGFQLGWTARSRAFRALRTAVMSRRASERREREMAQHLRVCEGFRVPDGPTVDDIAHGSLRDLAAAGQRNVRDLSNHLRYMAR